MTRPAELLRLAQLRVSSSDRSNCSGGRYGSGMQRLASLLAAYDEELRTDAETPGALAIARLGPLRLVTFPGGRGFVTYRDLAGADRDAIQGLVMDAVEHFGQDPSIKGVEWKTRGHDHAPGLHDALLNSGFTPEEPESIMIGEAQTLAVDVPTPAGVELRRVTTEADVRAMCAMQGAVFDDPDSEEIADAVLRRLTSDDGMELWVAESRGRSSARDDSSPSMRAGSPALGWCDHARVAGPGRLPRADRCTGKVGAAGRQDADPQRLDPMLPAESSNAPAWSGSPRPRHTSGDAESIPIVRTPVPPRKHWSFAP